MKPLWVVIILLCMASCAPVGSIITEKVTAPDGTVTERVEVTQPKDPVSPATVEKGSPKSKDPVFSASTGATQKVDRAAIKRVGIVTWAGIGLCVVAGVLIVGRAWFPIIPINATIVAGAIGVGLLFLPSLFTPWVTWILVGAGVLVAVLYLTGVLDNWKKLKQDD